MPPENEQNDQQTQGNEPKIDAKVVETLQNQLKDLERKYEETRQKLLDEDYLEFLAAKHSSGRQKAAEDEASKKQDGGKQTPVVDDELSEELNQIKSVVGELSKQVSYLTAIQEYESLRKQYDDVDDYIDDMAKVLEKNPNSMSIKEAYLLVKGEKAAAEKSSKKEAKNEEEQPAGKTWSSTEKPGGQRPDDRTMTSEPSTEEEAARATLEAIKKKYNLRSDAI